MRFEATRVAVYLSLNLEVVDDERGGDLLSLPLVSLTWALGWGWWLQQQLAGPAARWEVRLRLARMGLQVAWWVVEDLWTSKFTLERFLRCCGIPTPANAAG